MHAHSSVFRPRPRPPTAVSALVGTLIALGMLLTAELAHASDATGTSTVARVVSVNSIDDGRRVVIVAIVVRCMVESDVDCEPPGTRLRFLPENRQDVLDANLQRGELVRLDAWVLTGDGWMSSSNRYEGRVPR